MTAAEWSVLAGVFAGGAIPWLEAVVVIPAGILAGLSVPLVVVAGVTGNLLTVALAAAFGQRVRDWWLQRREAGRGVEGADEHGAAQAHRSRRQARVDRVMRRWGMLGLATLGPLGLGTQLSALAAVSVGVRAPVAFAWVGAGTVAWGLVAAALTVGGVSVLGVGA